MKLELRPGVEPGVLGLEGPAGAAPRSVEVPAGVEPALPVLQTGAWPLGDGTVAGHRGIEPRRQPGLESSALTQSVTRGADGRSRTGYLILTKDAHCQMCYVGMKWMRRDSNPLPQACKARALPSELRTHQYAVQGSNLPRPARRAGAQPLSQPRVVRDEGIEPP